MPKLSAERIATRRRRVEDAALALFRKRGFHGVGMRDIAKQAGVSLGNLYNYYATKEDIFVSIIDRLYAAFVAPDSPLAKFILESRFPDDMEEFGQAIGEMVEEHTDYLRMIYVDVAEFDGCHVRVHYEGLSAKFSFVMSRRFNELRERGWDDAKVDPAVAFTMVYMQFFNYFIVERMIGARRHIGLSEQEAIRAMSTLFRSGVTAMMRGEGEE